MYKISSETVSWVRESDPSDEDIDRILWVQSVCLNNPYDAQIMEDCVLSGFKVSDVRPDPYDPGRVYEVFPKIPPIPCFEDFDDQIKFWFVDAPDVEAVAVLSEN